MSDDKPKKKKDKRPSRFQPAIDVAVYFLTRWIAVFAHFVAVDDALRFARLLGRGLWLVYGRGRDRACENLRLSFPDKDPAWIERTARRSFEQLVMMAFDVLYTTRLIRLSTWRRYIELSDLAQPLRLMLAGRGAIMVTGHYGNFEILGYALATFGLESYSIARPIDNPYINRYLLGVRQRQGQIIIDKKGATEHMLRILASGYTLGFIADQNAGRKGLFVDFFGRKASTYKSIGLLAMEYNLPIVVGYARRVDDRYRFRVGVSRVIRPEDWRDQDDPLRWITAEYTRAIEDFVREDPEQYWWIHRRWKTRPPEERRALERAQQEAAAGTN
ncbi:MAG: lysophospholipid acyltransferase family protein [Sedimentisphaerales bacterium]|nr:lysophospholipid acyltransferase family protein [Sedimentisphaerales bacterium]